MCSKGDITGRTWSHFKPAPGSGRTGGGVGVCSQFARGAAVLAVNTEFYLNKAPQFTLSSPSATFLLQLVVTGVTLACCAAAGEPNGGATDTCSHSAVGCKAGISCFCHSNVSSVCTNRAPDQFPVIKRAECNRVSHHRLDENNQHGSVFLKIRSVRVSKNSRVLSLRQI